MSLALEDHPCFIFVNGCPHPVIEALHTRFVPDERSGERVISDRSDGHLTTPSLLLIGTRILVRDSSAGGEYFAIVQTAKYHVGSITEPSFWAHSFRSDGPPSGERT